MNSTTSTWRTRLGSMLNVKTLNETEKDAFAPKLGARERVIIIDDDPEWGNECAFSLQVLGYQPFLALNAETAISLLSTYEISIAILGHNTPGQDSATLINELIGAVGSQGRRIDFIMATSYAPKDAVASMQASAAEVLEKPIQLTDLDRALQRIKGLQESPAAPEVLLDKMSSLSVELQRLSSLIGNAILTPAAPAPHSPASAQEPSKEFSKADLSAFIREMLRKETKRRNIGGGQLFGDPVWEMLLDLLLAKLEDRRVSVSSACIASGAPMSTALRLVRRLDSEGVLIKIPDEGDRRRHFLMINADVEKALLDHVSEQVSQKRTR